MLICGVKVSHDGGVALIDGHKLVFSVEIEKLGNNPRYSPLDRIERIEEILRGEGVEPRDVGRFVVDGWYPPEGASDASVASRWRGRPVRLPVAPYVGEHEAGNPLHGQSFAGLDGSVFMGGYASYPHASNHVLGSYCSSPFAARGEDALVLVWDGGTLPRCFFVEAGQRRVRSLGPLLPWVGNLFGDFCSQLEPFWQDEAGCSEEELTRHDLEVPGKAMAYAALGRVEPAAFKAFDRLLDELGTVGVPAAKQLARRVLARRHELFTGLSNADLIASFQAFVGQALRDGFATLLRRQFPGRTPNLCLAGGCALNIKWNSLLRDSGLFAEIWVPPFPNDAGAAIGTACCEMVRQQGRFALDWQVYSGPRMHAGLLPPGWQASACDEAALAALLHREGEPVVVLHGRAELGPRALGNRSILAPATTVAMKDRLNQIKGRAGYRPVAPICLEERAAEVFEPGGSDPYMVFEHRMRPGWAERVPAVVHLDGTARLQTLRADTPGSSAGRILQHYERLSGIPVLCNTSANLNGHGFFADVGTAAAWGRTRYVWSDGLLYTNPRAAL